MAQVNSSSKIENKFREQLSSKMVEMPLFEFSQIFKYFKYLEHVLSRRNLIKVFPFSNGALFPIERTLLKQKFPT